MDKEAQVLKEFLERHGLLYSFECFLETEDLTLEDYGIDIGENYED